MAMQRAAQIQTGCKQLLYVGPVVLQEEPAVEKVKDALRRAKEVADAASALAKDALGAAGETAADVAERATRAASEAAEAATREPDLVRDSGPDVGGREAGRLREAGAGSEAEASGQCLGSRAQSQRNCSWIFGYGM
jgi:hypothetical protein